MRAIGMQTWGLVGGAILATAMCQYASAICVNQAGSHGCYTTIQMAVNAAPNYAVISVAAGTYKEDVTLWKPVQLVGAGAKWTVIEAAKMPNGIVVDGLHHPWLNNVTISGFTVKDALYEGVLVINAADVTIRENTIVGNDTYGPVFGSGPACKGQPAYETDESGDCGGGLHLMGVVHSVVADNYLTANADGILISDETRESFGNLITHNVVTKNPAECGIVLASHPPMGAMPPKFARHYGVNGNTVSENVSTKNGVKVGGAGVGLFSDGEGPGSVSGNVIIRNEATGNGMPGISLHSHAGPAFHAPADNMSGNMIIGNYIAGNGADGNDTKTPGTAGININSGGGGSPVYGTVISENIIRDEDVAIAVNTPAEVDAHLNDLLGGKVGVANICGVDGASCMGTVDATENYWGCAAGPGQGGCSWASGPHISWTPWLSDSITTDQMGWK
jgi:hypothetical protein